MSKQITITLPDGYEDTTYIVLVSAEPSRPTYATHVIRADSTEVEEIGEGYGLTSNLVDAAKVIRADHNRTVSTI